jgi:hypothetical protein
LLPIAADIPCWAQSGQSLIWLRLATSGQKEMLMLLPIAGKKPAKETAATRPSARQQRKSA